MFNASLEQFDTDGMTMEERLKKRYPFDITMKLKDFHLSGQPVELVEFLGEAQLKEIDMRLPVAMAYGVPEDDPTTRDTMLQKMSESQTGFILHGSGRLATVIDLSKLQLPPNAQFRYARVTASQEVDHDSLELIGTDRLYATDGPMAIEIVEIKD